MTAQARANRSASSLASSHRDGAVREEVTVTFKFLSSNAKAE